jgi:hypothetical protein
MMKKEKIKINKNLKVHLNRMKLKTHKMLEELLLFIYSYFLCFFNYKNKNYRFEIRQLLKTVM